MIHYLFIYKTLKKVCLGNCHEQRVELQQSQVNGFARNSTIYSYANLIKNKQYTVVY